MHIRHGLLRIIVTTGLAALGAPHQVYAQDEAWRRLLKASEAEQTAFVNSHLRAGMPPSDEFGMLILNKSEVTLPLIEQKIEEVLRSPVPPECFTDKSVDPRKFVHLGGACDHVCW